MLLTLSPLPAVWDIPAQAATLPLMTDARALLVPHEHLPVAQLQGQTLRWQQLALIQRARTAGLPLLGWGSGAALLGRSAGGKVVHHSLAGTWAWEGEPLWAHTLSSWEGECCTEVSGLEVWATLAGIPALWRLGQGIGLIDPQPTPEQVHILLRQLPQPLRQSATPLEAIGGPEALAAVLRDFYAQCRTDPLLAPTFAQVHDWQAHMTQVQLFWEGMLGEPGLSGPAWKGNLNHIHAPLRVTGAQLERWLELFEASTHKHLSEQGARVLVSKAQAMRQRLGPPKSVLRKAQTS